MIDFILFSAEAFIAYLFNPLAEASGNSSAIHLAEAGGNLPAMLLIDIKVVHQEGSAVSRNLRH